MTVTVETQLDLAGRVLELVRATAGADAEATVIVNRQEQALTRFANSYIHQNVADASTSVRLRLHLDGRTATGATTVIGGDALRDLVERTVTASRLSPLDPGWPGLAPPAATATAGSADEATAHASPAERADRVAAFVAAIGDLTGAGYCRTIHHAAAFANSAGQSVSGATTEAAMDGIARTASSDGVARLASTRLADIDGAVLGARAAAKARASADPVELPPGRYEVVMEHAAVVDLLVNLAVWGFNGRAAAERRSFVELGAQQMDVTVTLVDDATAPGRIGLPFDPEGTPKRRLELVEAGVSRAVAHDRRTARMAGTESTGHGVPGAATWGAFPLNLTLVAGGDGDGAVSEVDGAPADSSVAALVANVERGLLVTDSWYTRVLDPRPLVVTGLTRNGVWLIEHGEIVRPVRDLRFTQAYPQALAPGNVLGVGTHAIAIPGDWGAESFVAPALHLAAWNYTGGASG
jgi:predicted Zn-dependent protease